MPGRPRPRPRPSISGSIAPPSPTAHIFIASLYVHLYNRIPDAAGQTFWANELQANGIAPVLLTLLGVGGTDGAVVANRTEVGVYFAEKFLAAGAAPAFAWQQSILNSVDETSASVTAAKAQIDAWVAVAASPSRLRRQELFAPFAGSKQHFFCGNNRAASITAHFVMHGF